MGVEKKFLGFLPAKAKFVIGLIAVLTLFLNAVILIGADIQNGIHTGEWKPLWDDTAGKLLSLDASINAKINALLNYDDMPKELASQLRGDLVTDFLLFLMLVWIIKLIFTGIVSLFGMDKNQRQTIGMKIFLWSLAVLFSFLVTALYNGFYHHVWTFPLSGIWNLIIHFKEIMSAGSYSLVEKYLTNATISVA